VKNRPGRKASWLSSRSVPTEVLPEVAKAQDQPMIGHRGAKTEALLARLDEPLKAAFRTKQPVYIAATSATGLMEAAIRNGVRRKVLCLVNGSFSERFAKIATACGKEVVKAEVPLGQAFEAVAVNGLLDSSGADAVTLAHSETSTGVLNPIADIAKVVLAKPDVMYLVDAVTSLGGSPVETDAWGLDFVLTGSQKAFALPPGLAFGVASPRLLERAKALPNRGIYLDLIAYDTAIRKRQTPYTPAL
jgi:aspartate aminotransferase-like enzyme